MSHITIVISRTVPPPSSDSLEPAEGVNYASIAYTPPDDMSDADVAQHVRKLYKTVKEL